MYRPRMIHCRYNRYVWKIRFFQKKFRYFIISFFPHACIELHMFFKSPKISSWYFWHLLLLTLIMLIYFSNQYLWTISVKIHKHVYLQNSLSLSWIYTISFSRRTHLCYLTLVTIENQRIYISRYSLNYNRSLTAARRETVNVLLIAGYLVKLVSIFKQARRYRVLKTVKTFTIIWRWKIYE